jgi:hypothetical protein
MLVRRSSIITLVLLLGATAAIVSQRQAIIDWGLLRGYTPPATVAQLARTDTMTAHATHLFYVNHPQVTAGTAFTTHCPAGGEKTVVLGCYMGNDRGIYVYAVSDQRLTGVEQVTAAHEMLHAAYRRLSGNQRSKVDAMLVDYYQHDLRDQRIKDTIAAYTKSEPRDVVNEMHSIFGTEVAQLPAPLETYYKQYFADRSVVTAYTAQYQSEFTSRQNQVAEYDVQLTSIKQHIDTNEADLKARKATLDTQSQQLQAARDSNQAAAYNAQVGSYNQSVNEYNALLASTKQLINQYNGLVATRNAVAIEEQQLVQELSAGSLNAQ